MTLEQLKVHLYNRLHSLSGISVYDSKAPLQASFPYLTYKITSSSYTKRTREDKILEIDYWNNSNDDTDLLYASDRVKQGMNYGYQTENDGFYRSYIEFEGEIPDSSPDISRIQQRFLLCIG